MSLSAALRPLLLIHVMPWFQAPPVSEGFGWHWTMDKARPAEGRAASHYRPVIGAYDSLDPDVLELQVGWMKLAGFDGALADWYGTAPRYDYPMIHERTKALFAACERAGLKIGVVFEDQSVGNPLKNGVEGADSLAEGARRAGRWMREEWLGRPSWLTLKGKPVAPVFGPQAFGPAEWAEFRKSAGELHLVGLHTARPGFDGVMDWPLPSRGPEWSESFGERSKGQLIRIACAYPRFHDWYEEGGQPGHLDIPDRLGAGFARTLDLAIQSEPDAIQIATWNDWQEGTQIEPSIELGFRDLIITQQARRRIDPEFPFTAADLELPLALYRLRRKTGEPHLEIGAAIMEGRVEEARKALLG
jgi:hypothetical protein